MGTPFCARIVIGQTARVPPGHEAILQGRVQSRKKVNGIGVIEPADRNEIADKGMLVARTVVTAEQGVLPIRVFNPGRRECVVRRGTIWLVTLHL